MTLPQIIYNGIVILIDELVFGYVLITVFQFKRNKFFAISLFISISCAQSMFATFTMITNEAVIAEILSDYFVVLFTIWFTSFFLKGSVIYNQGIFNFYIMILGIIRLLIFSIKHFFLTDISSLATIKDWNEFPIVIIFLISTFLYVIIFRWIHNKNWIYKIPPKIVCTYWVFLLFLEILFDIFEVMGFYTINGLTVMPMIYLMTYCSVCLLICSIIYYAIKQNRNIIDLKKKEMMLQFECYGLLINQQNKLISFRHDFVNHQTIMSSLNQVSFIEIENYKDRLKQQIREVNSSKITQSRLIGMLLQYKERDWKEMGIESCIEIEDCLINNSISFFYVCSSFLQYITEQLSLTKSNQKKLRIIISSCENKTCILGEYSKNKKVNWMNYMKQRGDMKAVEEFIVLNHGSLEWQLKDEKWIGRVELENIDV